MGPGVVVEFVDPAGRMKFFHRVTPLGVPLDEFVRSVRLPNAGRPDREDKENPGRVKRWVRLKDPLGRTHRFTVILEVVEPGDGILPGRVQVVSLFPTE